DSYDDIYPSLEDHDPREWQNRFNAGRPPIVARPEASAARPAREVRRVRRSIFHQARVLTARYARLFVRDRRNVLILLAQIPVLALAGIVLVFQPLHSHLDIYVAVLLIVVLTAFAAVTMGLLVSGVVRNQDQATSFIPLVLIPQLFFGGSIVATAQISAPLRAVTKVVVTQWSYAGLGAAIDMNKRIAESPDYSKVSSFGKDYFTLSRGTTYLVL